MSAVMFENIFMILDLSCYATVLMFHEIMFTTAESGRIFVATQHLRTDTLPFLTERCFKSYNDHFFPPTTRISKWISSNFLKKNLIWFNYSLRLCTSKEYQTPTNTLVSWNAFGWGFGSVNGFYNYLGIRMTRNKLTTKRERYIF